VTIFAKGSVSMPGTFAQKVLAKHAGLASVEPGQIVTIEPNVVLSHDNSAPIAGIFQSMGAVRVADPERHVIVLDHAAPAPTTRHAENHRIIRDFVHSQGIEHFFDVGRGVCHQVLVEEGLALPGEIILGSDSHTPHAGAMGAFAVGIGRTEMASVWALGEIWLRVPETLLIQVDGVAPPYVTSKDLALEVLRRIKADGALYKSVEWQGSAIDTMSMDSRAVLTNMAAEMGAKNSFIAPNAESYSFLEARAKRPFSPLLPDHDAPYAERISIDAHRLTPLVACPHAVDHVKTLEQVAGTKLHQAFLGTCTNGRFEDLSIAASILESHHVSSDMRLVITPASSQIYLQALQAGYIETFIRAGAVVTNPGCGPCMGNHMGVPAAGERTISSANRNFQGRMGTRESEIYLASPWVVAASAILGEIPHPAQLQEFMV